MRRPPFAILLAACTASTACTSLVRETTRAATTSPWMLPVAEQAVRDALVANRWTDAARSSSTAPSDALLRDLYAGTVAYYAAQWDSSTVALTRASTLADDRYTKSLSRGALALATNDLALPYVPGQNERLLVHYYAMLAWLRRGATDDAVVEARRIGQMLAEYDGDRNTLDASTRAMLHALSGAVFERAGDVENANVAYRQARALHGGSLPWDVVDSAPKAATPKSARSGKRVVPDSGDVLVVVEQGFVAHRVEQRLVVRANGDAASHAANLFAGDDGLWADALQREIDDSDADSASASSAPAPQAFRAGGMTFSFDAARKHGDSAVVVDSERPRRTSSRLRLAWPAFRRPIPVPLARITFDAVTPDSSPRYSEATLRASLSDAEAGDFRRDRTARLTRLVIRAAAHATAVSEVGRKHRELASLLGTVSNAVERADTRSWHLLPGTIALTRLRLPVGTQTIAVDVNGTRQVIDTVQVQRNALTFATTRLWRTPLTAPVAGRNESIDPR